MRELELEGTLDIEVEGQPIKLIGSGSVIALELPGPSSLKPLMRPVLSRFHSLTSVQDFLKQTGLTVKLLVAGREIGRLGAEADATVVGRLLERLT